MACCLYSSQGSRTWLALLVPILALFARLSSLHGAFLIPITFIFLSAIFLLTSPKSKPIIPINPLPSIQEIHQPILQENTITNSSDCSYHDSVEVPLVKAEKGRREAAKKGKEEILMASQDVYSESESMDHCSTTSSEDHSSDMDWPYNLAQRVDSSDGSISDEESLIEIAIGKDPRWDMKKCCKLSQGFCDQDSIFEKDFWAEVYEMNEEDNLIEIDINIGSIKCSSF